MSVYSALNDAQQRRAQGRWMAPHSDPCGWITRPTPAQRANKCLAVRCYQTSKDTVKMTDSRMAFASRDLCCSVPKVSSDQFCLLASADSEGERGRTGVASVSERARASEGVCYFCGKERGGSTKVGLPECGGLRSLLFCGWGAAPRPHANFQRPPSSGRPRTRDHTS